MPVDYAQGKIYKLYINDLVYFGSTAQPRLSMRLGQHKNKYKHWLETGEKYYSSFGLFKVGTPTIELVELFPCDSKDELNARKGWYQRANDCVNIKKMGRTHEHNEAWRQANRPQINERERARYDANKPQIKAKRFAIKRTECLTLFIQKHIQSIQSI
jgi:hypothetical protein